MIVTKKWISPDTSRALSAYEMENNAYIVSYTFIRDYRWTPQAVAGMLGNMQAESTINPSRWQNDKKPETDEEKKTTGYGLVQWTPYTKYSDWAGNGWEGNGYKECERIQYECNNGLQWDATSTYNFSFKSYSKMYNTPTYMADAFLKNYERPENLNQPVRGQYAEQWFKYIIQYIMPKIWYWKF